MGALLEKDLTTPEYYPLTLNALQNACNQKSSRDPVMSLDEDAVQRCLERLQHLGLVHRLSGAGHRVEKFGHRLGDRLNLGRRELALLCAAVFLLVYLPVVELEEQYLAHLFPGFPEYARRVNKLLPSLPRKSHAKAFRFSLYRHNREYEAGLAFLIGVGLLVWKALT